MFAIGLSEEPKTKRLQGYSSNSLYSPIFLRLPVFSNIPSTPYIHSLSSLYSPIFIKLRVLQYSSYSLYSPLLLRRPVLSDIPPSLCIFQHSLNLVYSPKFLHVSSNIPPIPCIPRYTLYSLYSPIFLKLFAIITHIVLCEDLVFQIKKEKFYINHVIWQIDENPQN